MTINLRTFRLAQTPVTIERYTGAFDNGIYIYTLDSTFDIQASVQPYKTIEDDQIFEPDAAQWIHDIRIMFSREQIFENNETSTNPTRDIVIVLGEKFKPVKSEVWLHLTEPHYRTILRKWDGD